MSAPGRPKRELLPLGGTAHRAKGAPTSVMMVPHPASPRSAVADPGWRLVCALADIPVLGARVVVRPGHPDGNVAVFRTEDDRVFAVLDRCPHKGGPLSQGIVYGHRVACPLHNWSIELGSGAAVAPDVGCTHSFPVAVERGLVFAALE